MAARELETPQGSMSILTENISENVRGRPALLTAEIEAAYVALGLFSSSAPRRSKMNVYYRQRALAALGDGFEWLFDREKIMADAPGAHWKPAILIELGRIKDEGEMRAVAARLCEQKPATREAVLMIRRLRTGGLPESDALQLTNEIIRVINRYIGSHANVTKADVQSALRTAWASVDESELD